MLNGGTSLQIQPFHNMFPCNTIICHFVADYHNSPWATALHNLHVKFHETGQIKVNNMHILIYVLELQKQNPTNKIHFLLASLNIS